MPARRIAPTRLPASAPAPVPVAAPAPRAALAPTRLQGTSRQGLDVPLPAIQQRFPGLAVDEAERVQRVLHATMPQALTLREAMAWGTGVQQRYGELVERALALGQDPKRVAAQQHLQRLHELLDEVADAISEQLQPGLLSRWRAGPWELLARHRPEVDQLRHALGAAWQHLAAQRSALDELRRELRELVAELQAWGLAGGWLADALATHDDPRLAPAVLRRAGELTALHAHVVQAEALRERADADLDALCAAIQQAVLALLPAWLEKTLHAGSGATPTAARELHRELQSLLRLLPTHRP